MKLLFFVKETYNVLQTYISSTRQNKLCKAKERIFLEVSQYLVYFVSKK